MPEMDCSSRWLLNRSGFSSISQGLQFFFLFSCAVSLLAAFRFFWGWGVLSRLGTRAFVILQTNFLQWIGIRQINFAKSFMLEGFNQVCTSYQCSSISLTVHHVPNVNIWMRSCILSSHKSSEFSNVFYQWWTISPDSFYSRCFFPFWAFTNTYPLYAEGIIFSILHLIC